jgi:glutathione synthase/RimK-type ligase-like ATP-grasp enzyme
MRIALATCARLADLDEDERLLLPALRARGATVVPAVWDDPAVRWESFDVVVIRSTWDYCDRRDAFLAWTARVAARTRLVNPPAVVAWNTHKGYLRDLEALGVAVVPTIWCPRGELADLDALLDARGWDVAVVKPAVSAGARDTLRVTKDTRRAGRELLARLVATGDAMVQPYLASVEGHGERSLLFAGDAFSHAVRKHALLALGAIDPERQGEGLPSVVPSPEELAFARRVLAAAQRVTGASLGFTYARVDVAPGPAGLALMELEVTEPSLFLSADPGAADRFSAAILAATHRGA